MTGESRPDVARVSADQLDNFARVADGAVGEQEQQARVSAGHGLPQDPVERRQDVGAPHVGSDLPDILAGHSQRLLGSWRCRGEEQKPSYSPAKCSIHSCTRSLNLNHCCIFLRITQIPVDLRQLLRFIVWQKLNEQLIAITVESIYLWIWEVVMKLFKIFISRSP